HPAHCGDGVVDTGEICDAGGESIFCDADCTPAECGDGTLNVASGEDCDVMGESAMCDADCTIVMCGDGVVNTAAGEGCDDGNTIDTDGCSNACIPRSESTRLNSSHVKISYAVFC